MVEMFIRRGYKYHTFGRGERFLWWYITLRSTLASWTSIKNNFGQEAVGQILFLLHRLDMVDIDNDPPRLWQEAKSVPDLRLALMEIKGFEIWSVKEVQFWLSTLKLKDGKRAKLCFNKEAMDGCRLLGLDRSELSALDILLEDESIILRGIAVLKRNAMQLLRKDNANLKRKLDTL